MNTNKHIVLALVGIFSVISCGLIDDDLTTCAADHQMDYEMRLVTNVTTEIHTQLSMTTELSVATALETYLGDVFTDFAHDVDMVFYDVHGDSTRLFYEQHIMDASESSYTLSIPVREYMHIAMANLGENSDVTLEHIEKCHTASLMQASRDTVSSHKTGIYTARLPMDILEGQDQQFNVKLYMANCTSALVLDTLGSGIRDVKVFASGFANGFGLADSTYFFTHNPIVRAEKVPVNDDSDALLCFAAITFPSRDVDETKMRIDTDDPFVSEEAEDALWDYRVYVTLEDGSVTETLLGVKLPLRPGQMKVIKGGIIEDGSCVPRAPFVGASVTLDWNEIPELNIDV